MSINKDKLAKRQEIKGHNPDFVRPESWRYVRLETNWRKPKGIDHHSPSFACTTVERYLGR